MRAQWLQKAGSAELILVFSGWAVGATPFAHLQGAPDVLILHDYREEDIPQGMLAPYARINLLAYSLGVSVAARHLERLRPHHAVAVCGTPAAPSGIGPDIYAATLANITPAGLARFARRAGVCLSQAQDLHALRHELELLSARPPSEGSRYDLVIATTQDRIFTPPAMKSAWQTHEIHWVNSSHNPFPAWHSWAEVFA